MLRHGWRLGTLAALVMTVVVGAEGQDVVDSLASGGDHPRLLFEARVTGGVGGAVCHVEVLWPRTGVELETSLARDEVPRLTVTTQCINPRFTVLLVAVRPGEEPPVVTCSGVPEDMEVRLEFSSGRRDTLSVGGDGIACLVEEGQ